MNTGVNNQYTLRADKPFLIMVEGPSDKAMLGEMLRAFALNLPAYQIMPYGGKPNFKHVWKNVTEQPGFVNVTHLAVFRDADDNVEGAFQSVQHYFAGSSEIPDDAVPRVIAEPVNGTSMQTGVFIFPDGKANGALEELLLSSLDESLRDHMAQYVVEAERHLASDARDDFCNSSKSHSYAYSALFEVENFRDSFRKSAWNWQHSAFQPVRAFFLEFENT